MSFVYIIFLTIIVATSMAISFLIAYYESKRYRHRILDKIQEIERQIDEEINKLGVSDLKQTLSGRKLLELYGMPNKDNLEVVDIIEYLERSLLSVTYRFDEIISDLDKKVTALEKNLVRLENIIDVLEYENVRKTQEKERIAEILLWRPKTSEAPIIRAYVSGGIGKTRLVRKLYEFEELLSSEPESRKEVGIAHIVLAQMKDITKRKQEKIGEKEDDQENKE